ARALPALAAAIALAAALAYAGSSRLLVRHAPSPPTPLHLPPPAALHRTLSPNPPPPPTPTTTPPPTPPPPPPPTPPPTPTGPPSIPTPPSTWAAVSRALASADTRAAELTLRDLAARGDPSTRAKARLGMAQLALARGDRAHAAALAHQVLATPGIEPPL